MYMPRARFLLLFFLLQHLSNVYIYGLPVTPDHCLLRSVGVNNRENQAVRKTAIFV